MADPHRRGAAVTRPRRRRRPATSCPRSCRGRGGSASSAGATCPRRSSPALEQLDEARQKAAVDPEFQEELARLHRTYTGRPSIITEVPRLRRALRWGARLPQARGPQPHRVAQDQQRARPGAAHQADGQDPRHRRDRRRPARRRHRHGRGALRPGLRRLHGPGRHRAPGAQRRADEDARRRGGAGRPRQRDAQGRHQRGDARLGDQRRHDALHHRHGHRPAPVPRDGARLPRGHRRGGARAGARADRAAAGRRRRLRRRRLERHGHVPPLRRRMPACASSASRPAARASSPAGTRPASPRRRRPGCCTARCSYVMQDDDGQTVESHSISAGLDYPGVGPEHAWLHDSGRAEYRYATDDRGMEAFAPALPHRGHHPGHRSRPTPSSGAMEVGAELGPDGLLLVNLSGRGDKDMHTAAAYFGLVDEGRSDHRRPRRRGGLDRCRAEGRAALVGYLPVGFPTVEGSIDGDARARRGRLRRGRGRGAVQRPAHGRAGHPARRRDRAGRRLARRRRLPGDAAVARRRCRCPRHDVLEPRPAPRASSGSPRDLAATGGAGLITPDLIPEEAGEWLAASDEHGLDRVFLVAPSSTAERLVRRSRGPAAASSTPPSTMGVTGARSQRRRATPAAWSRAPGRYRPAGLRRPGRLDRCPGRRAGRLRRRRHRRLRARARPGRTRGTRRPARGVARTDDRAGRRSEDEGRR